MKKLITLFFLSGLWTSMSFSQSNYPEWPQPGAKWGVCHTIYDMFNGEWVVNSLPIVEYSRDTVINSVNYQLTEQISDNNDTLYHIYTRFSNDTIYRYLNGNEYLFFTYNTNIGDTLSLLRTGWQDYNEDTCSYPLELKLTEISYIQYSGQSRIQWKFNEIPNNQTPENNYRWIEGVGWMDYFPWLVDPGVDYCGSYVTDTGESTINYYTDNTQDTILFDASLCIYASLNENSKFNDDVSVYPNPGKDKVNINLPDKRNYLIRFTNIQGQEILNIIHEGSEFKEIDLKNMPKGIYLITIENQHSEVMRKRFVKQ